MINKELYTKVLKRFLSFTDGFIVVDNQAIVTDINDRYCAFLGKPKEEIVGYPIQM